jgi:hypothetical protein
MISNGGSAASLPVGGLGCHALEPLWVEAQSVPSATRVPCVRSLPVGWTFGTAKAGNGLSAITLNNDRAGPGALQMILTARCAEAGAGRPPQTEGQLKAHQAPAVSGGPGFAATYYEPFAGGCTTIALHSATGLSAVTSGLRADERLIVGDVRRRALERALEQRSGGRLHLK